ncbi:hypothetical protein, partial [Deinococcus knuensis]|uniref:hypothetical protein n=1 Tax=Deinococcus knuensis TaxID=1837380 RepID=UPI001E2E4A7E
AEQESANCVSVDQKSKMSGTEVQQTREMFNLTVSEAHTYYVGQDGWLVHNAKGFSICADAFLDHILMPELKRDGTVAGGHTIGAMEQLRVKLGLPSTSLTTSVNAKGVTEAKLTLANGNTIVKSIIPDNLVMKVADYASKQKYLPNTPRELKAFGYIWEVKPGMAGGGPTIYPKGTY